MMDTISLMPQELIQGIAMYLFHYDVFQCQLVCKHWFSKWSCYLLKRVHTRGSFEFNALHKYLKFKTKQEEAGSNGIIVDADLTITAGQQVRTLIVQKGHVTPSMLGELPILFPFVERFMIDDLALSDNAQNAFLPDHKYIRQQKELELVKANFINDPCHWRTTLKSLVEINGTTITNALLLPSNNDNSTVSLKILYLRFGNSNDRVNGKLNLLKKGLNNAPLLQTLSLENVFLAPEELELIHLQCPQLRRLRLVDVILCPITTKIVRDVSLEQVRPAPPSLQTLEIIDGGFLRTNDNDNKAFWLDYINRKYSHVNSLHIESLQQEQENQQIQLPVRRRQLPVRQAIQSC
ncbi:hypothetical protein BDF20DRAFT_476916 [Mycotypha africana]|uniref:uncharacterized protein n=1 Tax=Mycotypha africana TaxID=64632 RepID=UPI002300DB87|nr:uncharacterized protein BDF20DRAFT_476916 [Mycotypha africana]KAI8982490.1 hypothetical protein BDF20DRAFT_476916 [Mycotypha africana]